MSTSHSGPEVHPAQAEQYDPPSTPTGVTLLVSAAIMIIVVFLLEVLYAQLLGGRVEEVPTTPSEAVQLHEEQVRHLEAGEVHEKQDDPTSAWKTGGEPIDRAMDDIIKRYGRGR
jgi:hypothetical protein